jgi:hypothetical protein
MTADERFAASADAARAETEAQGLPSLIEDPGFYRRLAAWSTPADDRIAA